MQAYWLKSALSVLGIHELPGQETHPLILHWWKQIKAPFTDDETAWCAAFVGGILEDCKIQSSRSAAARSYEKWGIKLSDICEGAIVVFWRGTPNSGQGHVGFVIGKDSVGNIMVIGGNQGNEVSIKSFSTDRVLSYHWPKDITLPEQYGMDSLSLMDSNGIVSNNEA